MNHPNEIPKYEDSIVNQIKRYKVWITESDQDITKTTMGNVDHFIHTILCLSKFTISEYRILNTVANDIFLRAGEAQGSPDVYHQNAAIMLALFHKDAFLNDPYIIDRFEYRRDDILRKLFLLIMDIYIPSNNPERTIKFFVSQQFPEIIRNLSNRPWIMEQIDQFDDDFLNPKEIVILFKILGGIYENEQDSYEFLKEIHHMHHTIYYHRSQVDKIAGRYQRMYHQLEDDDFRWLITDIFVLFGDFYSPNDLDERVTQFLKDHAESCRETIDSKGIHILFYEIGNLIVSNDKRRVRVDQMRYLADQIETQWDNFVPDKFTEIKEIVTESMIYATDTPLAYLDEITQIATEAIHKDSPAMNKAEKRIYKAYRTYKGAEEKVDSQITKAVKGLGKLATGDVREEIIEGKKFSAIGLLKRLMGTVAIFSFGKIRGACILLTKYALKKSVTQSERRKIIMEIETELAMLDEKIQDARSDGNREAKYAMMRTKKELENAKQRIEYGMEADRGSLSKAKNVLNESRKERGVN